MGVGIYVRTKYTDKLSYIMENDNWQGISVTYVLPEKNVDNILLNEKKCIESAQYIAKIKLRDKPRNYLSSTRWKVEILEIYKGDSSLKKGQIIDYYTTSGYLMAESDAWIGGFTNLMKEDREYIIYFNAGFVEDNKIKNYVSPGDAYFRYFCIDDLENITDQKLYKKNENIYPMELVLKNEFFAENQQTIEKIQAFKDAFFEEWNISAQINAGK